MANPMTEDTTENDSPTGPSPLGETPVSLNGTADAEAATVNLLAVASLALSGLGFLTLLRLADRRDRTPARALGLFLTTSTESVAGGVLGLYAATRVRNPEQPGQGFLLAAAGAVLGVITTALNINWMRTRRHI